MVKIVSLIGSLEQFDLANILRRIEVFSKTGLLVVRQGEMWVEFYFRKGQLVCVGPVRANVTLLDRLLQAGLLSYQTLPQVKQIVGPSEVNETRIALALINEGYLSREILRAWASHETSRILQTIFTWPTGEISFEEDCATPTDRLLIALSISALLETLPATTAHPASSGAPSTDELIHVPEHLARSMSISASPTMPVGGGQTAVSSRPGMLNAAQLIENPPVFSQPATPAGGPGLLSAAQLIEDLPFKPADAGGSINAAQLLGDVQLPAPAAARSSALFGAEVDISAPSQVSILPPQPVRNPQPPMRIDTSFMTPELILCPVDLSTLRGRNPQVQLTPDQWSLFALIDGQASLQTVCQMLKAPSEQVCMVAGELIAIGLVMPLNPTTGTMNELVSPAMSSSARYPVWTPQPATYAPPMAAQAQWDGGKSSMPFATGRAQALPNQSQLSPVYAPVGGYR